MEDDTLEVSLADESYSLTVTEGEGEQVINFVDNILKIDDNTK